ncbi:hypothetical protein E2C01_037608 [Portunus trituberculatus]|uniref:Uncharacterized protein n=1 Tax=Portunus trituberculatus TaxID=210409 RepID=A0A5B7F8K3_PORTR|nr:hypothetical protein [Portunus trituberculatus]
MQMARDKDLELDPKSGKEKEKKRQVGARRSVVVEDGVAWVASSSWDIKRIEEGQIDETDEGTWRMEEIFWF